MSDTLLLRNRYRIIEPLGSGAGGSVYAVEDLHRPRGDADRLALKALFPRPDETNLLEGLRQEFRILATLRHPQLARVYDFGVIPHDSGIAPPECAEGYFLTRDLIDGCDLATHAVSSSLGQICRLAQRSAQLLALLHRSGMVHGDFKPANVIVDEQKRLHLIDFGLSGLEGRRGVSGTAAYLAPEMLRGEAFDCRADLYSLGITLYQLATGQLPLPGAPLAELLDWHLNGAPLTIRSRLPEAPSELDQIIARLTQRAPEERYPSASETALALANVCRMLGVDPHDALDIPGPQIAADTLFEPLSWLEDFTLQQRNEATSSETVVALVVGEPGVGKSTLLRELAWRRQLDGFEVLRAEFQQTDQRPYGALRDILDQVAGLCGRPHALVSSRFERPAEGSGRTPTDEGRSNRRFTLLQQLADYVTAAAREQPLLLLLDSVEQAGDESIEALRFFAHTLRRAPVAIVLAVEANALARDALRPAQRLDLHGLPLSALEAMIERLSGRPDPALAARIQRHTGGNPRFVQEVLKALDERGWSTTFDLAALLPPSELEQMYARRWHVAALSERLVLEALALIGRPTSSALLAQVLRRAGPADAAPAGRNGLRCQLEQLEQDAWLARNGVDSWSFAQGRVAAIVTRWLEPKRSRQLHRAIMELLDEDSDHDLLERTRHALGAGDLALAFQELPQALDQLRHLGAYIQAIELARGALELGEATQPSGPLARQLEQLRYELGQLYRLAGDYAGAQAQLTPLACGEPCTDHWRSARIELARVYRASGEPARALELLKPLASAELGAGVDDEALLANAETLAELDRHEEVLETARRALQHPAESRPATRAALHSQMAWSLGHLQRLDEARREFEAALSAADAEHDAQATVDILNRWAVVSWRQGDYDQVEPRYLEALEVAQRIGDIERAAVVRFNLAAYHLQRAELAAALNHLPESLRLFEAIGAHTKAASARCNLGQLQLELGLYEQAQSTLAQARDQMSGLGRTSGEALATLLLGLVAARHRRFDDARDAIRRAHQLYRQVGQRRDGADALLDLAEVELEADEPEQARAALQAAAHEADLELVPDLQARSVALRARVAATHPEAKQKDRAVGRELAQAKDVARRLDSPRTDWQCCIAAMALWRAQGDSRRALAEGRRALEILQRVARGLPRDVQRAFWADGRRRKIQRETDVLASEIMSDSEQLALETTLASATPEGVGRDALTHERFYRLLEIYRQINSELDSRRLLEMVMDTAVELTGAERGFLLLAQPNGELCTEVARNLDPSKQGYNYSRSIAERAFRTEQPVVTVSAHRDPRFSEFASVHQQQLESVLCIPIHAPGGVMGVLYMESRFRSGRFQPEDQRLLLAFGDQVAIALTNARLYEQVRQQTDELQLAKAEIERLAEQRANLLAERTAELEQAERDLATTRRQLHSESGRFGLVGLSAPMMRLYEMVDRVAPADLPVLVEGESGTGKEMVARAIHQQSRRRSKRMVSVNCAAIPENLLESELFGHVRGAFTGADRDRKGLFAVADGGTLFLDEIGDMPMRMQVDLLRALQEQTIRPVGGSRDVKVNVRVVAASNKSLAGLVQSGQFREDLFYRLHVVKLDLPPLRDRTDDIPLLVDHFLGRIGDQFGGLRRRVTRAALDALATYRWPGNVRQLEHALMNAAILSPAEVLDTSDFRLESPRDPSSTEPRPAAVTHHEPTSESVPSEKARILKALEQCSGNKTKAAQALGMPRRTFYRRLRSYGID
jgi:serine/threonine-protein kinase PknK